MFILTSLAARRFGQALGLAGWLLAGCAGPSPPTGSPGNSQRGAVRLAAGPQYARSAAWRFWWGTHYRAIWAAPVTVPVLRLGTVVPGGMVPVQAGGSYQSRTLRLQTRTGSQYMLRSVDKDGSAALPAGWRRQLLGGVMKDQTSAGLPYGAYIAAHLADAAGVYHSNPRLVYLPDDLALGKFRSGYANALYLLEERPDGDQRHQASFGHSPAVVNSARMLAELRRSPSAQVAARAYLRARLLDVWLGDWSRREDQWRWASFSVAGGTTYRPIPRDRDQAFFLFDDGLLTRCISWLVPKYHSFYPAISLRSVDGLTTTARALDRTLLATLTPEDFRQEADSLRMRMTDAVIIRALSEGPAETRAAIAATLLPALRARRTQLPAVAQRYFEILARDAWLIGTDADERFVLRGVGGGVLAQLFVRRLQQPDSLIAERVYRPQDTSSLSLYGLAGNDVFDVQGALPAGVAVHLYGGSGQTKVTCAKPVSAAVTWHIASTAEHAPMPGIAIEKDPQPELTATGAAWMKRYRLRD